MALSTGTGPALLTRHGFDIEAALWDGAGDKIFNE